MTAGNKKKHIKPICINWNYGSQKANQEFAKKHLLPGILSAFNHKNHTQYKWGVYSSVGEWGDIFGSFVLDKKVPLWQAHWDGKDDSLALGKGYHFGGWTKAKGKQYKGASKSKPLFDHNIFQI
jgi:hypothetical protein